MDNTTKGQKFREFIVYTFSTIIKPNSFNAFTKSIFEKREKINKDFKYIKLTFNDICECKTCTIINRSIKPFCPIDIF